jgi:CxxC-x17-CxxC domain-containing protein
MASRRMDAVRPFNGFPRKTDANNGYVIQLCNSCGERIFIPFNQLGDKPQVCSDCYTGGL